MDLATLLGIVLGIAFLIYGMYDGGDITSFLSVSSLVVTAGGGIASTLVAFSLEDFKNVFKALPKLFEESYSHLLEQFKCSWRCPKKQDEKVFWL